MQTWARAITMTICAGWLTACADPLPVETPALDALDRPIAALTRCVVARDWACTTTHTREIVAIFDAAR